MVTSHPRCANQLEEPNSRNEGPLHIEDLLRPGNRGMVFNPEVNPHGKMGVIADGEVPLERRKKFARSLQRLPRRSAGRVGRIWDKLRKEDGEVRERGIGAGWASRRFKERRRSRSRQGGRRSRDRDRGRPGGGRPTHRAVHGAACQFDPHPGLERGREALHGLAESILRIGDAKPGR